MNVFFYGLFMDEHLLQEQGLRPCNARFAKLAGYRLRIARRANLIQDDGASCCGVVMELPPDDVLALYAKPSVSDYKPISVSVRLEDGSEQAAICYVLSAEKDAQGSNADYAKKLYQLAKALHFPDDYLAEIQLASDTRERLDQQ